MNIFKTIKDYILFIIGLIIILLFAASQGNLKSMVILSIPIIISFYFSRNLIFKFKEKKLIEKIIILMLIVITLFLSIGLLFQKPQYVLNNDEAIAYRSLRLAIAKSGYDGGGELSLEHFDILGKMVKDGGKDWFSGNSYWYEGKIIDTAEYEITFITDGVYTASFKISKKYKDSDVLLGYNFEKSEEKGYMFFITD